MPRIVTTEASLYNGISQQNPELRLPSQLEDATNVALTVPRGVEKRPPVETVTTLTGRYRDDSLVHPIDYDSGESYMLVIPGLGSSIGTAAYDTDGVQYPVVFDNAAATNYVFATNPSTGKMTPMDDLSLTSVLDYTFITNKNVSTALTNAPDAALLNEAYLWVKNGVQQVERSITLDGNTYTFAKSANNDSQEVIDQFVADITGLAGYSATKISKSVMKVTKDDTTQFTFDATDTYGDTTMEVSLSWGTTLEALPPKATNDQLMTIESVEAIDADYFLKYSTTTEEWFEEQAPGEDHNINNTLMPHAFIRKVDDGVGTVTGIPNRVYFSVEQLTYSPRTSGGEDSSPNPSFIGKAVTDVFFFKNRLGFLSEDNVILSATDDIFRFWPTTVKEVLDDDPIDIAISSNSNVKLYHATTFPDSLIIVGDKQQFSLNSGGKAFTVENVRLEPTTSYPASTTVPPLTIGASMYFTVPQNTNTSVREYSVQPDTLVTDAADITAHVPKLIDNNIKQIISENNQEYLFLINKDGWVGNSENYFDVYKFYWQGNEKVQSSWIRWTTWFTPIGGMTYNGFLYLIGSEKISDIDFRTFIGKIDLRDKPTEYESEPGRPYKVSRPYIDRMSLLGDTTAVCEPLIEVSSEQYTNINNLQGGTHVLVNRVTGETFTIDDTLSIDGKFFIVVDCSESGGASKPDNAAADCLTIGTYTLGGCTE